MKDFLIRLHTNRLTSDGYRIVALIAAVVILLWLDSWLPRDSGETLLSPLLNTIAAITAIAGFTHLTRRVLFPKLDLQEIALKALDAPVGAAVIFFSICMVVTALIIANVVMLR